ncbi:MAG: hypothetical protein ACE5PT_03370 [Gemmatimonadales bacterium]
MRCEEARLVLWPKPGPRATGRPADRALLHYAECEACQRFFRHQQALEDRLRQVGEGVTVPPSLAGRVGTLVERQAIRERRSRTGRRLSFLGLGAAGLAAAAALLVLLVGPSDRGSDMARELVAQTQAMLGEATGHTSSDLGETEFWLQSQVQYPVELPAISGAYLVGGRVARMGDTRTAAAVYLLHGKPLAYFALPSPEALGKGVGTDRVEAVSRNGYEVAMWVEPGGARAVVASMPRDHVVGVAEECRTLMGQSSPD